MSNEFDKIIKESLKEGIDALIKNLGIDAVEKTFLEPKFQITEEREADFLLKIKDSQGEKFILHLEFQSTNDKEMIFRMLRYNVFILQKYKLPTKQFVLFVGRRKMSMQNKIDYPNHRYFYELINFKEIPYEVFLNSKNPSEIVLAILCKISNPHKTVKEILQKLVKKVKEEITLSKYIVQLEVLSQLRNLQQVVNEEENKMPIIFDLQKDIRFKQGLEQGLEKGLEQGREDEIKRTVKTILEFKFGAESYEVFVKVDSLHGLEKLEKLKEIAIRTENIQEILSFLG